MGMIERRIKDGSGRVCVKRVKQEQKEGGCARKKRISKKESLKTRLKTKDEGRTAKGDGKGENGDDDCENDDEE